MLTSLFVFLILKISFFSSLLIYCIYQFTFIFGGYLVRAETLVAKEKDFLAKIDMLKQNFPAVAKRIFDGNKIRSVVRSTFLIDKNGLLIRKWVNVRPQGHASSVKDQLNKSFNFEIGF